MMSAMTLPGGLQAHEDSRPKWRPISFWPWTLAAAAAVVIGASVSIILLLTIAGGAKPGTDRANARLDAVRTGLAVGAGIGAAAGLVLAFRRQHHQEIATDLTDRDATERRITELYAKAVEQLGSDKAPVRLGGLYALERLAQDNPAHRQTIVNVICAYLRMPFSVTALTSDPVPDASEDPEEGTQLETASGGDAAVGREGLYDRGPELQERQVRLTAQRILAEHLRDDRAKDRRSTDSPDPRFWPSIRLDLAGATLIDFRLENGVIADADFTAATFSGDAWFGGAAFTGHAAAVFRGATFGRFALFDKATFTSGAVFDEAAFTEGALFSEATFTGDAVFMRATFDSDAGFDGATFNDAAAFIGVTFNGDARFDGVIFNGDAGMIGAVFSGDAVFFEPDGSGGYTVVRAGRKAT
jgi:hypothetical protein